MGFQDAFEAELLEARRGVEEQCGSLDIARGAVTDDEEDSVPSTPSSSYWWSDNLICAAAAAGAHIPSTVQPIQVLSACTGCCAEGEVLKACIPERRIASMGTSFFGGHVLFSSIVHCRHCRPNPDSSDSEIHGGSWGVVITYSFIPLLIVSLRGQHFYRLSYLQVGLTSK